MKTCGSCLFQTDMEVQNGKARTFCLFHNDWHNSSDYCECWKKYAYGLSRDHRIEIAKDIRNREEAKKIREEDKKERKRNKIIDLIIKFIGGIFKI